MATTTNTLIKEPVTKSMILYSVTKETISEMSEKYLSLTVAGIDDKEGLKVVKAARLLCRGARVAIEKTRKEAKEESLRYGQKVDAEAKLLTSLIEPIEKHLTHQEETVEREIARIAKEKEDAVFAARHAMIAEAGGATPERLLRLMKEDEFLAELARVKIETLDRIERDATEALEKKRLLAEAEALRLEREELARLRKEQEESAAAQRAEQRRLAREQDEEFSRIRKEQEDKIAAEMTAKRQQLEEEAATQRAEHDRLNRELAAERSRLRLFEAVEVARQEAESCVETVAAAFTLPDDVVDAEYAVTTVATKSDEQELSMLNLSDRWIISRSAAIDAIERLIELGDVAIDLDMVPYCRSSGVPLGEADDEWYL